MQNLTILLAKTKHILSSTIQSADLLYISQHNMAYIAMVIVHNEIWILTLVIHCVCYLFLFSKYRKKWCKYHFAIRILLCSWYRTKQLMKISAVCHGSPILSGNFLEQLNHAHKIRQTASFVYHPLKTKSQNLKISLHHSQATIKKQIADVAMVTL